MKKIHKIFLIIILLEIILVAVSYFIPTKCGSACAKPSILNPFGQFKGMCILSCEFYQPGVAFYVSLDLLLLTLIGFLVYLVFNKLFKR